MYSVSPRYRKIFWRAINLGCVALCAVGGYDSMRPGSLQKDNPDIVLCAAILLSAAALPTFSVHFAIRRWGPDASAALHCLGTP